MTKFAAFTLCATLIAVAAPAARKQPIATPFGTPIDCVYARDIDTTQVRDDRTIDFIMRDRKVYRNTLPNSCPSLGFEESFSYELRTSQLCSVDIIRVLPRGAPITGATCGLGKFQPVKLAR